MNQTVRGLIVFVSVLVTIGIWAPLSNSPRLGPGGSTITDTYFGVLRYGTLTARMKEPNYEFNWKLDPARLVATLALTAVFWTAVGLLLRRTRRSAADGAEPQQL